MIKITKTVQVSVTDFTHKWILPDCATLISSTVDGDIITAVFDYCDNNCLVNFNEATLVIEDSDGCIVEQIIEVANPCSEFQWTEGGIKEVFDCDPCNFKLKAPTNKANVTYEWTYDTDVFNGIQTNDSLELIYISNSYFNGGNVPISVTATDQFGCSLEAAFIYDFCVDPGGDFNYNMTCSLKTKIATEITTGYIAPITEACGYEIDWNTYIWNPTTSTEGINPTITTRSTGILIEMPVTDEPTLLKMDGFVRDCRGVIIPILLCLFTPDCTLQGSDIPTFTATFGCEDCTDDTQGRGTSALNGRGLNCLGPLTIPLNDLIIGDPDYSTFAFIPGIGQTLISNTEMSTPNGTVSLNMNQEIFVNYPSGVSLTELINYQIEVGGVLVTGDVLLKSSKCTDNPVAVNDTFCMYTIAESELIDFTLNDSGIFDTLVITEFPSIQVIQNGLKLRFISGSEEVNTLLKYKLVSPDGTESNVATIDITVVDNDKMTTNKSICQGESLDLANLITDPAASWVFAGYTADYSAIPGTLDAPDFQVGDQIFDTVITPAAAGIYTFSNGMINDPCAGTYSVNIEVIEPQGTTDVDIEVCETVELLNLDDQIMAEDGEWMYISSTPITTFDGQSFNPFAEGVGIYQFRWTKDNEGLYNNVSCDSTLILTVDVKPNGDTLPFVCLDYCSYGPDPEEDPDCKTPIIIESLPTTGCTYDLYNEVNAPAGSTLQIIDAPYFPINLTFNGVTQTYNQLDMLPEGTAIWDNGKAPLGTYRFRLTYDSPCTKTLDFEANLYKATCAIQFTTIEVCNGVAPFNILTTITGGSNCLTDNNLTITLVSENLTGDGTPDYDINTGDFNPIVPGEWVFNITAGVAGGDPNCEACSTEEEIRVVVFPLPGPGEPNPGTVCNDGTCTVAVYPGMFNPSQSILGTFCYDGFNVLVDGTPDTGGWGGTEPTLNPGDVSGPSYTFEGAAPGFYFFSNKVTDSNGCSSTSQTVVQVVASGAAGTGSSQDVCAIEPECIDLTTLVSGYAAGGNWSVISGTPENAFIACDPGIYIAGDDASFNTENQPVGTYVFHYTLTTGDVAIYPIFDGCDACDGSVAVVTVNITEAVLPGNGSSQAVCS